MDSYLDIAHKVLRAAKRPMSAASILAAAYRAQIVPNHLKGQTQQKTLQARLSEDILHNRDASLFYRTEPGVFFLNELISDPSIPDQYKAKFKARRRTRDLRKDAPLGIKRTFLRSWLKENNHDDAKAFFSAAEKGNSVKYLSADDELEYAALWTFSIIKRGRNMFSYRIGRYRDDRDAFANKRTIGIPGAVTINDLTLFSDFDFGAAENAISSISLDLDLSYKSFDNEDVGKPLLKFIVEAEGDRNNTVALAVLEWNCPEWFEPTKHRLSLNDPSWMDPTVAPNNPDDFEPWSVVALEEVYKNRRGLA